MIMGEIIGIKKQGVDQSQYIMVTNKCFFDQLFQLIDDTVFLCISQFM